MEDCTAAPPFLSSTTFMNASIIVSHSSSLSEVGGGPNISAITGRKQEISAMHPYIELEEDKHSGYRTIHADRYQAAVLPPECNGRKRRRHALRIHADRYQAAVLPPECNGRKRRRHAVYSGGRYRLSYLYRFLLLPLSRLLPSPHSLLLLMTLLQLLLLLLHSHYPHLLHLLLY